MILQKNQHGGGTEPTSYSVSESKLGTSSTSYSSSAAVLGCCCLGVAFIPTT